MSISNRERVRRGLDELKPPLVAYVERELKARNTYWKEELLSKNKNLLTNDDGSIKWDTQGLLKTMVDNWMSVFRYVLGSVERSYVGELLNVRNKWAHEEVFTSDDVYRALDTMQRLLEAISEGQKAEVVGAMKIDLQRQVFAEQARNQTRYKQLNLEGTPTVGLKPWRELITPHPDVASGRYMQAEFAADLAQVYRDQGSTEYRDPVEFFRRTYITSGLRTLLVEGIQRITNTGGNPVVELQTNFGGGKTHSMLALYHILGGADLGGLEGLEPVLQEAGVTTLPMVKRAVIVGTALSPGQSISKGDGVVVNTLWGELAWQLGGAKAYAMIEDSDRQRTSPGSNELSSLLAAHAPCLVLIDEWVAYARQMVDKPDLPGGNFESQVSFAQALTEAAKAVPGALIVASIPQSKIEIGGTHGEFALDALKNVFTRVASPWRPATGDEGFEIVRRRLFQPMSGRDNFAARDAVVEAFAKMYRDNAAEFPSEAREGSYKDDLRAAYPFHPELFRRLYDDWSTLDKFQRTRGVLRLLAKVVHRLWEGQDHGLMILPASIPMDDNAVKSELTRYLDDVWEPIISQDVDGPNSMPLSVDQEYPNLGRYSACRRIARALYMGTAPGSRTQQPGVGIERLRIASVQPGENVATFGDALRRLTERGVYIHSDGNRYWMATRPNLNRTAEDRAAAYLRDLEEINARIIQDLKGDRSRGEFEAVQVCPENTLAVPDEPETRLLVLGPEYPHQKGKMDSTGVSGALEYLQKRGNSARLNQNALLFVLPDQKELENLQDAVAHLVAWESIVKDKVSLNLDQFQLAQAESKVVEFTATVGIRLMSTWIWALAPMQSTPSSAISWEEIKLTGSEPIPKRASKKLGDQELFLPALGGLRLRMVLDQYLWKERNHVTFGELSEWFARYLYLPRIASRDVLKGALKDGLAAMMPEDTFAVAGSYDERESRYLDLRIRTGAPSTIDSKTCIVKTPIAKAQKQQEEKAIVTPPLVGSGSGSGSDPDTGDVSPPTPPPPSSRRPQAYHGSLKLDPLKLSSSVQKIAEEIVSHMAHWEDLTITLEIHGEQPNGIDETTERILKENSVALKLDHFDLE